MCVKEKTSKSTFVAACQMGVTQRSDQQRFVKVLAVLKNQPFRYRVQRSNLDEVCRTPPGGSLPNSINLCASR